MQSITSKLSVVATAVLALAVSGCNTEREKNHDRAILKAGQQVSADMVGWVAVPNTAPATKKDKVDYACQAKVACEDMSGTLTVDPVEAMTSCVAANVGILDSYTTDQQRMFEAAYATCMDKTGCDFVS